MTKNTKSKAPEIHHCQLFKGETVENVTFADGTQAAVIRRKDQQIYCAPGRAANFGGVGEKVLPQTEHFWTETKEGDSLQFFHNKETGLVVVDFIDKAERGGCELLRHTLRPGSSFKHLKK